MNRLAAIGSLAVAAAIAIPGGAAFASTPAHIGGISIGSGDQIAAPIGLPVNICGVSIAILGIAGSGCEGGAAVQDDLSPAAGVPGASVGNTSVGSGNGVSLPVSVPVNVCGVSVAVLGSAKSGCKGGATVVTHRVLRPPVGTGSGGGTGGGGTGGGGTGGGTGSGGHHPPRHHKHHNHHCTHPKQKEHLPSIVIKQPIGPKGGQPVTLISHLLPTTGVDLLGVLALAFAALGSGIGALVFGRQRRAVAR